MQKVVILTAIAAEHRAVRAHLSNHDEIVHPRTGTVYDHGLFTDSKGTWEVLVVEMGMGNTSAALIAQEAIEFLNPDNIFFIGVAGGLKDVRPGDVVASTKIYQYGSGKEDADSFYPRAEVGLSAYSLTQRARAVVVNDEWQTRIKGPRTALAPQALVGAIAAGERVIASEAAPTALFLKKQYSDALAVEMEGYGVLAAAQTNRRVDAIVIRGISDTLGNKAELDGQNYQDIAARHASAFAFEMLAKMATNSASSTQASSSSQPAASRVEPTNTPPIRASATQASSIRIFYSYVDADKGLIDDLKKQMTSLRRNKVIQEWDRSLVLPGDPFRERITRHLSQDDLFIIGISPAYLASDEHYDEMEEILRQRARGAKVAPVLLHRTSGIQDLEIGSLRMLPSNDKPISENKTAALGEVANEIGKEVKKLLGKEH